jgi:hypothetical protein
MKFIVELRLSADSQSKLSDAFSRWRPQRDAGVMFRGARIGSRHNVIFVVGEGEDEERIARACQSWEQHGNYRIYPVSDAE